MKKITDLEEQKDALERQVAVQQQASPGIATVEAAPAANADSSIQEQLLMKVSTTVALCLGSSSAHIVSLWWCKVTAMWLSLKARAAQHKTQQLNLDISIAALIKVHILCPSAQALASLNTTLLALSALSVERH